ncbi:MAG: GTP-binding protein, partial [Lentisphaerae bacterium]|nr:GTP-binding protein [Lentisphaerota bacterium]
MSVADIRNMVLLGHIGSGKTTFCEALALKTGVINKLGSVEAGNSLSDFTPEEVQRKTTMYAKPLSGDCKTKSGKPVSLTVIDTPGVDDFAGHVITALKVSDIAVIMVDASSGIQVGTNKAWRRCVNEASPRAIVVTGLDKENASYEKTVSAIREVWGNSCIPFVYPKAGLEGLIDVLASKDIPEELAGSVEEAKGEIVEFAAETDDSLLEKYLGGEELAPDEIASGAKAAICDGRLIPIFPVVPTKGIGIDEFVENVQRLFPSPLERQHKDAEGNVIDASENAPFTGLVWRVATDPYAGKLAYLRVFGGTLNADDEVFNSAKDAKERLSGIS